MHDNRVRKGKTGCQTFLKIDTSPIRHFPKMDSSSIGEMSDWGSVHLRKCLDRPAFLSLCSVWKKTCFSTMLFFSGKSRKNDFTRRTRHFFVQPKSTLFWTMKSYQRGFSGWFILIRCGQDTKKVAPLPKQNLESESKPFSDLETTSSTIEYGLDGSGWSITSSEL
jgi:hypothetical protein